MEMGRWPKRGRTEQTQNRRAEKERTVTDWRLGGSKAGNGEMDQKRGWMSSGVNTSLPRGIEVLWHHFPQKGQSWGTIHSARQKCLSQIYPFTQISKQCSLCILAYKRKNGILCNDVSCIIESHVSGFIIHSGMAYAIHIDVFIITLLITCHNTWTELQPWCWCEFLRNVWECKCKWRVSDVSDVVVLYLSIIRPAHTQTRIDVSK